MNSVLPIYRLPIDWVVHLIDHRSDQQQIQNIRKLIENGQLFAFDTDDAKFLSSTIEQLSYVRLFKKIPSRSIIYQFDLVNKPSLLQVAIRSGDRQEKNVVLLDLQEIFRLANHDQRFSSFMHLIEQLFNHPDAIKLSHSFYNDLSQLKCSYDHHCFHESILRHFIELSDLFRQIYSKDTKQMVYGLQQMTSTTLQHKLNKKQQCANWSRRPLTTLLTEYAAIDVIVMIEIYDCLQEKLVQLSLTCEKFETTLDLKDISLHICECEQRFLSNKSLKKHRQTCQQPPKGRGYLPPALQRMHQSAKSLSLSEQARRSSPFDRWNRLNESRPPDVDYFLHDDDHEVAQAFGLQTNNQSTNHNDLDRTPSQSKSTMKIAAYPPKSQSGSSSSNEKALLDRLQDDFDCETDFHRHSFGLGGRGRLLNLPSGSGSSLPNFLSH